MIHLPGRARDHPDRDRLAQRYERFKAAARHERVCPDWGHIKTVSDENELQDVLDSRFSPGFDLDTYRLLLRHLRTCPNVISYEREDRRISERPRLSMEAPG